MDLNKKRLIKQLMQSALFGGRIFDAEAACYLMHNGFITRRDSTIGDSTMLTEKGERLLQELEATWENQT